ncbi:MAG: signal peptidase I [Chloroflexi bacterium]|nr:signal peptidase I [Chloroflexota bacterium]
MIDLAGPGLVAAIAAGMAAAVAVRQVVWLTRVESWSMAPTLRPGSLLLTRRLRRSDGVRRGEVVVLRSAELGRRVVKRVVGLPGETVVVDGRGVSVDGARLPEPYVLGNGGAGGSYSVPDGTYFVLGDNRARSSDSRSWREPFVARSAIEGRWIRPPHGSLRGQLEAVRRVQGRERPRDSASGAIARSAHGKPLPARGARARARRIDGMNST